jgi:pyruvate/2-oxoglutarate dehydrogenase complex dihydrolipoamide dehydrogenase (E3) component
MGDFDVVVLGGGTAGGHVAELAARGGRSVALVEAGLIGGESPYLACLPSNSLLLAAGRGEPWEDAVARRDEVTGGLDDSGSARRLAELGVTVVRGTGRIERPGTVVVTLAAGGEPVIGPGADQVTGTGAGTEPGAGTVAEPGTDVESDAGAGGGPVTLGYRDLVIATGCEPVAPPIEGLADIPTWTTAEGLCSPDLPRRLIVLGGGPAGCELTQIYATFGSQVTLVEAERVLLPGEPAFAGEMLAAALRRAGAEICLGSPAAKAERTPDGLTLALEDGTQIDADRLLLASGRRPRLGGLGLDVLGIAVTPGSALPAEATGLVADAGPGGGRVWAAGDVTGITHAHAGRYQAEVVAANILGAHREADYRAIPRCVFTMPSVYAVGLVPDALVPDATASTADSEDGPAGESWGTGGTAGGSASMAAGRPGLVTARAQLGDTARARLSQDDLGQLELYADGASGELVGAVAVGPDAASWMAEVTLAIRAKVPVTILADVVHAFPTYGEAMETALRELAGTLRSGAPLSGTLPTGTWSGPGIADQEVRRLSEMDIETPEGDAIEQRQEIVADESTTSTRREVRFDVDEADAAEQERSIGFDDDDYR